MFCHSREKCVMAVRERQARYQKLTPGIGRRAKLYALSGSSTATTTILSGCRPAASHDKSSFSTLLTRHTGTLAAACTFACLCIAPRAVAQTQQLGCPAAQDPAAFGKMCVRLAVRNGSIVATNTEFWIPPAFRPALSRRLSIDQAESVLRAQLDHVLAGLPKPYQAALAGEKEPSSTDAATNTLRAFNGSLAEYAVPMQTWSDSNPNRLQPADVLTDGSPFFAPIVGSMMTITLIYDQQLSTLDRSLAIFRFPNPFQSNTVILQLPNTTSPAQQARIRSLRKALLPLDGTLWDGAAIVQKLQSYYQRLGLNAQIAALPSGNNTVMISEGTRIALVILPEPDVTDHDIDKILWIVLSQRDFNTAMKHRPLLSDGVRTVDYVRDLGYHPGDEPYALAGRLQDQQTLLSEIGFVASVIPNATRSGNTQPYQDLRIQKPTTPPPSNGAIPKPAPASIDPHGQVSAVTSTALRPQPADAAPATSPNKDKPWYIGGGFEYRPGQALRVFGLLQRSRFKFPFENGSFSGQLGYPSGGVRSLNYSADYLNFERFHQRVSVRLNGSTDVNQHRFLFNNKLDERRTGGFGQLMWEPFHDLNGALLQITTEVRRATVTLSSNTATASKVNLSTLRTGGVYLLQSAVSEFPYRLKIEPFIETGLGFAATEKPFGLGGISANYHQTAGPIAPDIAAHFQNASRDTPLVELPSFGGGEVVRGFRADDAIGRRVWSLQNELWLPLRPAPAQAPTGKLDLIVSQLRLAPFVDFGGAYQTLASTPGFRIGPGLGLRLAMDKIVFKLDWAYGFGPAATSGSRGKFYFTVVSNLPF